MKKLFTQLGLTMILFLALSLGANAQLYINEFMASNDQAFPGPQGDYPDWIEIYNAGSEAVNLAGYYMSDDLLDPEKMFQIPDTYPDSVTVPAGGFIVFYANKEEGSSVMNLNFKLSGDGEAIGFWSPDEEFVDSLTFPAQETDISYGRYPDGTDAWYFMEDYTPGAANEHTSSIAINEEITNISLYPNPCSTNLNVAFEGSAVREIRITDISGRIVYSQMTDNNHLSINTENMPSGLYFMSLLGEDTHICRKFSINK